MKPSCLKQLLLHEQFFKTEMRCELAKRFDLASFLKPVKLNSHMLAPPTFRGLLSRLSEKALVLSSQLWTLEASKMSGEALVIL